MLFKSLKSFRVNLILTLCLLKLVGKRVNDGIEAVDSGISRGFWIKWFELLIIQSLANIGNLLKNRKREFCDSITGRALFNK